MVFFSLLLRRLSGGCWAGKGQPCWWGLRQGHLGFAQGATSLNSQGPHLPQNEGAAATPAGQLQRSSHPWYFPSHKPHETALGGDGERAHFRSGCENLSLADEVPSTKRGQLWGLGDQSEGVPLGLVFERKGTLTMW